MANRFGLQCFTDLKGSSQLAEDAGNQVFVREMTEHSRVIQEFLQLLGGTYKSMSDGHFLTVDYLEHAATLCALLQEYYKPQPALERRELQLKIGLGFGVVQDVSQDVLGSGANKAARIQNHAQPGQVLVDQEFVDGLVKASGPRFRGYFNSIGEKELRGIEPRLQELFLFDWENYARDNPNESLAGAIHRQLQQADVETSLLNPEVFSRAGIIIWPVVPRDIVTAIHRGQTEMVRLLAYLGWRVKLLIADCGAKNNYERPYADRFHKNLRGYLLKRQVNVEESFFLSDFFDPKNQEYDRMQSLFRAIASDLTLQDLLDINNKKYSRGVIKEIRDTATLDCLRPALSLAAVSHLVEKESRRSIVISGADEQILWERAYSIRTTQDKIGVLMNPVLTQHGTYTGRQTRKWPSWPSKKALVRGMKNTNLGWWTFRLHAYLPAFPAMAVPLGTANVTPENWKNQLTIPDEVDREALADHVWALLELSD